MVISRCIIDIEQCVLSIGNNSQITIRTIWKDIYLSQIKLLWVFTKMK